MQKGLCLGSMKSNEKLIKTCRIGTVYLAANKDNFRKKNIKTDCTQWPMNFRQSDCRDYGI